MEKNVGARAIDEGYIAIGFPELGNLNQYSSAEEFKCALKKAYSNNNLRSRGQHSGVLDRFVHKMNVRDIVVYPSKHDGKVNIGLIDGNAEYFENDIDGLPNHRSVKWIKHIPRSKFSYDVLSEIRACLTTFQIKKTEKEIKSLIKDDMKSKESDFSDDNEFEETVKEFSKMAEEYAPDFVMNKILKNLTYYDFEKLVEDIFKAMGYTTKVTQKTHDGGFDVIAHKDRLGCKPPILKVQCKHTADRIDVSDVRSLLGVLGSGEYGIFVAPSTYGVDSQRIERLDPRLKLIDRTELFKLICEYYDRLSPVYRNLLPLKNIFVADI